MGSELVAANEFSGLLVVVGLVQAETLGRLGGGLRPLYGDGVERDSEELVVVAVGPGMGQPDGDPGSLGED